MRVDKKSQESQVTKVTTAAAFSMWIVKKGQEAGKKRQKKETKRQ